MVAKRRTKPPHEPTKASRDTVSMHTLVGTPQADVARIIGIDEMNNHLIEIARNTRR